MFNLFRRFRRTLHKSRRSKSPPKGNYYIYTKLDDAPQQESQLRNQISLASNALLTLRRQLEDRKAVRTSDMSCRLTLSPPQYEYALEANSTTDNYRSISHEGLHMPWIDDTWICAKDASYLADAEQALRANNAALAMKLAWQVIECNPFLCELDEMRCRLFIAAVQHYTRRYQDSTKSLELVDELNTSYAVLNNTESTVIDGITNFIRAKNLMESRQLTHAYWSFEEVLQLPGYGEKAREYQEALANLTQLDSSGFGSSPSASTHALLDWDQDS